MKCLRKYKWVKMPRASIPACKGLLGAWARLSAAAAFRKGCAVYCGHKNLVGPGEWVGGMVGVKAILGVQRREKAEKLLSELVSLGYLEVTYDCRTKKLSYRVLDWVPKCSGQEASNGVVYATDEYGFFGIPRSLTDRIALQGRVFDESDAWLDLWCHTVYEDYGNAFSFLAPAVQYGKYGSVLSLQKLGERWGWEKTKVWRFFQKHDTVFKLHGLPGTYGCLIFNTAYPIKQMAEDPSDEKIMCILNEMRISARNIHKTRTETVSINQLIAWYSRAVLSSLQQDKVKVKIRNSVALFNTHIRAYFSHGRNCKHGRRCQYDCQGWLIAQSQKIIKPKRIRGPCCRYEIPQKR